MSKQASKTLIGAFVVGAVALLIAGVLLFGSGRFLSERKTYVCYFQGSVKGLNVGSPVTFRGVKIGEVTHITVRFYPQERDFRIPVLIQIDLTRMSIAGSERSIKEFVRTTERGKMIHELINRGLRAQLQAVSLVTGQLGVNLDFYPETPAKFVRLTEEYPEIPTIPSGMEQLESTLDKFLTTVKNLNLETLVTNLTETAQGINKVVNSPEVDESIQTLNHTLNDLRILVQNANNRIEPLASSVQGTVEEVRSVVGKINDRVVPLGESIQQSVDAARVALEKTEKALANVESATSENSALRYELLDMIEQVSSAARSMRIMADYLEQHPESIMRGKGKSGGE